MEVLAVKLGAFGDVVHTLPAIASLAAGGASVTWIVDPRWQPLLSGNPSVTRVHTFDRRSASSVAETWRFLRKNRFHVAVDFQGLLKSAAVVKASGAQMRVGFSASYARERGAAWLYNRHVVPTGSHVVEHLLDLAGAAGAPVRDYSFWLPEGTLEGELPAEPFVLTSPTAGWSAKEWPIESYIALSARLQEAGIKLVANFPPGRVVPIDGAVIHESMLPGLIYATRRAAAVLGVDSGPLHLAAALQKPGVALFGPTSPERNGPFQNSIAVLRSPGAGTTYRRDREISPAMRALGVDLVFDSLMKCLDTSSRNRTQIS